MIRPSAAAAFAFCTFSPIAPPVARSQDTLVVPRLTGAVNRQQPNTARLACPAATPHCDRAATHFHPANRARLCGTPGNILEGTGR
jgi:hypothetical protein